MAVAATADAGSRPNAARGAVLSMALCVAMLAGIGIAVIGNGRRLFKPERPARIGERLILNQTRTGDRTCL